jgi:hypothetical protein
MSCKSCFQEVSSEGCVVSCCNGCCKDKDCFVHKIKKGVKIEFQHDKVNEFFKDTDVNPKDYQCQICKFRGIKMVFQCEHTTCEECGTKIIHCPFCRMEIKDRRKIRI